MFTRNTLLASLFLATSALAGTETIAPAPAVIAPEADPFFTGAFTAGYATNYTGRGYVTSRIGMEGEGIDILALMLNHKINENWDFQTRMSYRISNSGHTLFGNPDYAPAYAAYGLTGSIYDANLENELSIAAEARYTKDKFSVGMGADYVHGGLLGLLAKHYAHKSASSVTELFVSPEYSPFPWMTFACPVHYSIQGVTGWWIEPSVTFKAPLIGTAEDVRMAAMLSFNATFTVNYFKESLGACYNGAQTFYIELKTPYFVGEQKNWIITPAVSFNWLGPAAMIANENCSYAAATMDDAYVPFQTFQVVGSISLTYRF